MKKTLSLIAIMISLLSSQAYAKTEGNYVGINLLRSTLKTKSTSTFTNMNSLTRKSNQSINGLGLKYSYAYNFNNFFANNEISYELLDNEITSASYVVGSNGYSFLQNLNIKKAITLKSNFGYDFNDKFAIYIPIGVSRFDYNIKSNDIYFIGGKLNSFTTSVKSGNKSAIFSGLGLSYESKKNWILNLEYNKYQNIKINSISSSNGGKTNIKTNLDLIKLGLSYKF